MGSYLSGRAVTLRYAGEECTRATNKGCVQGSIGGPILWNLLLDPLLRQLERNGDYCQAFADDILLVFSGDTALEIERQANAALARVRTWGIKNRLNFAPHKTCAMVLTRKLKYDVPRLSMGGVGIGMSQEIRILGLIIDSKLTFNTHITSACKKAIGIYKQLAKTARVSWGLHPEVIRNIYAAAVEPVVLYAACAWSQAATKLGVRKQLNALQRGFAQKLCKAYRTVSLNSALLLAGILPLDLRIREVASLYEAKKGITSEELRGMEVERMAPAIEAPHPAEQICLEFGSLIDEDQYRRHSNFAIRIFTDGSKIEGRVGAALSVWKADAEIKALKFALPSFCTVYQAELLALCRAGDEALKSRECSFGIFSDSMAALQTVTNPGSTHPLAVETRDTLRRCKLQNKSVSLFWIKAHAGLSGNERADELAKEAALKSKKKPEYDLCPVSFARREIRLATLSEWNHRYRSGETASTTKLFFPDAVAAYGIVRKTNITHVLTQIFTGHGGFSLYLKRFKCKENPSCVCDPAVEESVPHILVECPMFAAQRHDLEQEINLTLCLENIPEIIGGKNRKIFLEFCTYIANIVIKRNK